MISAKTSIGPRGSQSRTSTGTQDRIIRANRISRKIHRTQSMTIPMRTTFGLQLPLPVQTRAPSLRPLAQHHGEHRTGVFLTISATRSEGSQFRPSRSALVEEPAGDPFLVLGRHGDVLRREQEDLAGDPLDGAAEA